MTERRCRRCDWRSVHNVDSDESDLSADAQLALHAIESGHPVCIVCYRSLTEHEKQTCEHCITAAQTNLAGIRLLYDELPRHLRTVASTVHGQGADDGAGLLGGDVLALLGPGSEGLDEDGKTSKAGDPISVAYELSWWEKNWREARHEQQIEADTTPRPASRVFRDAAGYLERHTRWAANSQYGFHRYAADLEALHLRLEVATGRVRRPTPLDVRCFNCRGLLVHKIAATGLEEPARTCRSCGQTYDDMQFAMSRAQAYLDSRSWFDTEGEEWATLASLAVRFERSENTLKKWRYDRVVRSTTAAGVVYLHVGDAEVQDATRPKRNRAS